MRFRIRKVICLLLVFLAFPLLFSGCVKQEKVCTGEDKLQIVTTIFPPFDFARQISGGKAQISMLLKPGMESHSYEPSPADIIAIENCDLFIYNGGESDVWVDELLKTINSDTIQILKMMDCVDGLEETAVEGMQGVHSHTHEEEHHHGEGETAEYDEHVWTAPLNACAITRKIAEKMIALDPNNASTYQNNAENYISLLSELDQEIQTIVSEGKRKMILFGDRFPFRYFADAYNLDYRAAFPGCSAESEPSAKTVAYLIDKARQEKIPNIFYIEFSNLKIARTLQEETGAIPLLFHSCHNLSKDEMDKGVTYLELMRKNAENLKEALN